MRISFWAMSVFGLLLTGCGGSSFSSSEGASSDTAQTFDIRIAFKASAGEQDIACNVTLTGLGMAGSEVSATLSDFRFFVHDFVLITDGGDEIPVTLDSTAAGQNSRVALMDFRDVIPCDASGAESMVYKDTVMASVRLEPATVITDVRFTLGVPFDLNHANPATAADPLANPGLAAGMSWGWQAGYKFTGLDVFPVGGITRPSDDSWASTKWNVHLGSTGCTETDTSLASGSEQSCIAYNRPVITLSLLDQAPAGALVDELDLYAIQLDYAKLVAGSNLAEDGYGAAGCMSRASDPECPAIFTRLGLPTPNPDASASTRGHTVEAATQSVFSVVLK